jgi:phenylpropionate dioxygenase-like ring-hydroxylating dioxygenase large terminal subunit
VDLRTVKLEPDHWYPVARASEVRPGKVHAATFAGQPIALIRAESGELSALEDRCAHRQVPLTEGVLCGNILRCGYHGWGYALDGRCVDVPYLAGAERSINRVRRYPCREAWGLVFVFPGDAAKAQTALFPRADSYADPAFKTRTLDRLVNCHWSFMHENLMDMNHQFLHRSLMGGISARLLGHERGNGWLEARYTFARTKGRQSWGEKLMIGEREEDAHGDRDTMTIRTDYPYQTLTFRRKGRRELSLDLWLAYVPVDREQKVNRTLGLMMIRRPRIPGAIHAAWPFIARFTDGIFAQDKRIVELEQQAWDAQGGDRNREVFPVIRALREVLAAGRLGSPSR